jgi:hypothetical protein
MLRTRLTISEFVFKQLAQQIIPVWFVLWYYILRIVNLIMDLLNKCNCLCACVCVLGRCDRNDREEHKGYQHDWRATE